jgi:uncharacterized protein YjbI with pentapeptide repeats
MDLTKHELAYLKEGITKENLLSYPVLNGYNFQGARMDSARFFFAHIQNSDLRGVKWKAYNMVIPPYVVR